MKLMAALALPLVLSLAACGGGKPKGVVRFTGLAPNSAAQKAKDNRAVTVTCPNPRCMNPISFGATRCTVEYEYTVPRPLHLRQLTERPPQEGQKSRG